MISIWEPGVGMDPSSCERTVMLVCRPEQREILSKVWRGMRAAWPDPFEAPESTVVDLDCLANHAGEIDSCAALVLEAGPDHQALQFQAFDRLDEELVPIVHLTGPHTEGEPGANGRDDIEILSLSHQMDPGLLAPLLEGVMRRQRVVRRLDSELRLSRRFQGGLRGQIDKIHEELQLAASVQREFLPTTIPSGENIEVEVLFRPCGYVSGDIYDVQRLNDDLVSIFVADAVGHGVPAALMTMVLARCLTTKVNDTGREEILSPSEVLANMNRELIRRHGDTPRFATAVYGIIDGRTREVRIAGAGHPHPLRIKSDGASQVVPTEGGLLGIFPEDSFEEIRFTLDSDEMLVLYSDGFETAFPAKRADQFGRRVPNQHYIGRFARIAEMWWSHGLPAAMRALEQCIDEQVGSLHQVDDLTAILAVPRVESALESMIGSAERHLREA